MDDETMTLQARTTTATTTLKASTKATVAVGPAPPVMTADARVESPAILAYARDACARDLLMEIAIEGGYGLCGAADENEALRVLEAEPPSVIVIEVDGVEGRRLLRSLRKDVRWARIPVLALTATNNPMIGVTIDAPIFFLPQLDGFETAIRDCFDGDDVPTGPPTYVWPRRTPTA